MKHLESQLIWIAKKSGGCALLNGTGHDYGSLPESDLSDMAFFIEQIRIILPVLGFDFLRNQQRLVEPSNNQDALQSSALFVMEVAKYKITAKAQEVDGEFLVLAGSRARNVWGK